ncbi:TIR domain-containing protein [Lentzea sp. NPDC005914]|uniref:nSTAND1 domain-containing NTPase n=1 Tax=Lentzea sp. NPDC005914 TaxID=3154572 RepID=UPI0033FA6ABD
MARVFLSYSVADEHLAADVRRMLVVEGHDVFLDHDPQAGIRPGQAWEAGLHAQLRQADVTVCLMTATYVESRWCFAEIFTAQTLGQLVVPLLLQRGVTHRLLDAVQHIDFTAEDGPARLAARLREVDACGGVGWADGLSPFPGLRAFDARWRQAFRGRDQEIRELSALVASSKEMLLLVGPSGCGKSSLVRAGLVPAVAAEPGWLTVRPVVPGERVVAELALVLTQRARELGPEWTVAEVRATLATDCGLASVADELLAAAPGRRDRLLLVVDQFEELVTQTGTEARQRFARLLAEGLRGRVSIVATLRPEFLAAVQADEALDALPRKLVEVRVLRRRTLPAVIEQPARLAGLEIDAELVDRLVADTDNGEALPLLAFTLQQLAEGVGRGGQLSAERYDRLGGVAGALAGQADRALAAAVERTGRRPDEVIAGLVRLVTVDEHGLPARWRVAADDLPDHHRAALDEFVARRLLVTDTHQGAATITVAHEAFLTSWPPLADAIAEAGAALKARPQIERAAREWRESGNAPLHLWSGPQLARATADIGAHDLGEEGREFLDASRRRERRLRTRLVSVLTGLLVLALIAAGLAIYGQQNALREQRLATVNALITQTDAIRDRDPRTALRLAVAAQHFSDDERTQINLFNAYKDMNVLASLPGHTKWVRQVAWSPDSRTLATASADKTVLLWDMTDDKPRRLATLTGHPNIEVSLAWSPDSRTLATAGGSEVLLWDLTDRERPQRTAGLVGHTGGVLSMAWSHNGKTLATAGFDHTIRLRDPIRHVGTLTGHNDSVESLSWSPDDRTLASASRDHDVRLWDFTEPESPHLAGDPLHHDTDVLSAAWSPDGRTLATTSGWGVHLWDPATRRHTRLDGHIEEVLAAAWSPDGRTLASASNDNTVRLWDPATGLQIGNTLIGHTNNVLSIAWAPDGRSFATAGNDLSVIVWDVAARTRPRRLGKLTDPARIAAWAPDGHTLAAASDNIIRLWDLSERNRPRRTGITLTGPEASALAWSPDGKFLAIANTDLTIALWDVSAEPRRIATLTGHSKRARAMAWSPNGRILATASEDNTVHLWDTTGPQPRRIAALTDHTDVVRSVAWSPDSRTLATASNDQTVILWDVTAEPRRVGTLIGHQEGVRAVAWSPDGQTIATGSYDDTILIWDVTQKQVIAAVIGHINDVVSLAWSADGRTLASASSDRMAILWDFTARDEPRRLANLNGHTGGLTSVTWSRDLLATTSEDNTVQLWDLTGLDELSKHGADWACVSAGGGLTEQEWSRYAPTLPYEQTC